MNQEGQDLKEQIKESIEQVADAGDASKKEPVSTVSDEAGAKSEMSKTEEGVDTPISESTESETEATIDDDDTKVDEKNYNWYILQCQTGKEYQVKERIAQLLEKEPTDNVGKVLIPEEDTIEIKNNQRVEKVRRIYPSYVFIQLVAREDVFYSIRRVPGVAKFIGTFNQPTPVQDEEILKVLRKVGDKTQKVNVDFEVGESIKVIDGPFTGYVGEISEISLEKGKLKSSILIFGRDTPVELEFAQVEHITNG